LKDIACEESYGSCSASFSWFCAFDPGVCSHKGRFIRARGSEKREESDEATEEATEERYKNAEQGNERLEETSQA
jgi:hypothetical protein